MKESESERIKEQVEEGESDDSTFTLYKEVGKDATVKINKKEGDQLGFEVKGKKG